MRKNYAEDTISYELDNGYCIEKAVYNEFTKYYAVYSSYKADGGFFKKNFELMRTDAYKKDCCYWIKHNNSTVGGVIMEQNELSEVFFIPPFSKEEEVIKLLKGVLLSWSDSEKDINIYSISPEHIDIYKEIGFIEYERGRWMIKPTGNFEVEWENDWEVILPKEENKEDIIELLYEAFGDEQTIEQWNSFGDEYFNKDENDELLNMASTLVYHKKNNELIGVCLMSEWQE